MKPLALFRRQAVAPGQRYREAAPGLFGVAAPVWIVERLFTKAYDELPYARLVCAADASLSKVLSVHALADRTRFRLLEAAEPRAARTEDDAACAFAPLGSLPRG